QSCQYFSKPFHVSFFETVTQVIHRATEHTAIGQYVPVFHPKGTFHKFGGHSQQSTDYHPESSPCTSQGDRNGNPGYVSKSHGPRNGSGQCLEMSHLPGSIRIVIFSFGKIYGMLESPNIDKAHPDGEEQCAKH